eukprot:1092657-Pelagomonas_calceolata.AAC.4
MMQLGASEQGMYHGLEDQLLGIAVAKERPDLEDEKNKLIIQGNILEDENAVDILQSSKILSDEISEKQKISDETEAKIDEARAGYKPVAHHSSLLYFVVRAYFANWILSLAGLQLCCLMGFA